MEIQTASNTTIDYNVALTLTSPELTQLKAYTAKTLCHVAHVVMSNHIERTGSDA